MVLLGIDQLVDLLSGALTSKRGHFDRLFYFCCYVVISSPDDIEDERKLAKLFSSIVCVGRTLLQCQHPVFSADKLPNSKKITQIVYT